MAESLHIYYIGAPIEQTTPPSFLIQRWYEGTSVADSDELSVEDKILVFEMFEAFSHFVFKRARGYMVHTGLQACVIDDGRVMIYDVATHVKYVDSFRLFILILMV